MACNDPECSENSCNCTHAYCECHPPERCCRNVAVVGPFTPCGKAATYFYKHGEDICSYCEEHNSPCGEPVKGRV